MFFAKPVRNVSPKIHKAVLQPDLDSGNAEFRWCSNVKKYGKGLLGGSVRLEEVPVGKYASAVAYADGDKILYFSKDGLYIYEYGGSELLCADCTCDYATGVEYHDRLVLSSSQVGTFAPDEDDEMQKASDVGFDRLAVCGERLCAVAGHKFYFTFPGKADDMFGAEFVTLYTPCDAAVSVSDKVYILGNVCYSFAPDGESVESKVAPIADGIGKVAAKTVACIGNKAVFATESGLYALSQGKVTPIMPQLNGWVRANDGFACAHNGLYYLCCQLTDGKEAVLVIDIDAQRIVEVFDGGFNCMYSDGSTLYAAKKGKLYLIRSDGDENCCWGASDIDFGSAAVKHLQRMSVALRGEADVWLYSRGESRRYRVKCKRGSVTLPVRGVGTSFAVQISSPSGVRIDGVQLVAYSYGEGV